MKILNLLSCITLVLLQIGCKPAPEAPQVPTDTQTTPAPAAIVAAAQSETPAQACILKLGFEAWEPYQYVDMDQKAAGLDIELMQAVAKEMNCEIVTQQGTWVELIAGLKAGEVDLLLGASKTEAREEYAFFSAPYRKEQFVLFVRSMDVASLPQNTISDFLTDGKKLGIVSEYFYGDELAQLYNDEKLKPHFVEASLSELNLARLMDEDIDGMLEDKIVAASMIRRKGLDKTISPSSISLGDNDVYVMFSKNSTDESKVSAFNAAMTTIRENNVYDTIMARYQQ
ncbi:MAG: transporter substrate-binding domain-containing protein [Gammaproteobacteria bacterium]|nr:transporter substrate-binding domain-containing protein [Gammaproteobacteria bacterium]